MVQRVQRRVITTTYLSPAHCSASRAASVLLAKLNSTEGVLIPHGAVVSRFVASLYSMFYSTVGPYPYSRDLNIATLWGSLALWLGGRLHLWFKFMYGLTVSLYALCLFLFTACNSCKEGEVCSVVSESNGARYPICKGPTTGRHNTFIIYFEVWFYIVPCSGGSGEPHFSACPEDYRCVTHNTTNIRYCLQSCYLENGGCPPEQVCYYERKDEDCNQLLEPCFKTACTDVPGKQCTIATL